MSKKYRSNKGKSSYFHNRKQPAIMRLTGDGIEFEDFPLLGTGKIDAVSNFTLKRVVANTSTKFVAIVTDKLGDLTVTIEKNGSFLATVDHREAKKNAPIWAKIFILGMPDVQTYTDKERFCWEHEWILNVIRRKVRNIKVLK